MCVSVPRSIFCQYSSRSHATLQISCFPSLSLSLPLCVCILSCQYLSLCVLSGQYHACRTGEKIVSKERVDTPLILYRRCGRSLHVLTVRRTDRNCCCVWPPPGGVCPRVYGWVCQGVCVCVFVCGWVCQGEYVCVCVCVGPDGTATRECLCALKEEQQSIVEGGEARSHRASLLDSYLSGNFLHHTLLIISIKYISTVKLYLVHSLTNLHTTFPL